MAQVNVTIAGRPYRMACADGEEEHLIGLARQIDAKINEMRGAFGEIGDQRLTVMGAITIADELSEARRRIARLEAELGSLNEAQEAKRDIDHAWSNTVADSIEEAARRIETLAHQMNAGGRKA